MKLVFQVFGMMFCLYWLAKLLHYTSLRLDDTDKCHLLQKILIAICFILWVLALPITALCGSVNWFHYKRLRCSIAKEISEDSLSANQNTSFIPTEMLAAILLIIVIVLTIDTSAKKSEIEDLRNQIKESHADYEDGYDAGYYDGRDEGEKEAYNSGCRDGYDSGYEVGYDEGYLYGIEAAYNYFSEYGFQDSDYKGSD